VFVVTKIMHAEARVALNDHVYITSYMVFLVALKKLKITICRYRAGIESERVNRAIKASISPSFVIDLDALVPITAIITTIITPRNIASLNETIRSFSIFFVFRSVAPAIFTSDAEKNPIATTVRKEISAHAKDA